MIAASSQPESQARQNSAAKSLQWPTLIEFLRALQRRWLIVLVLGAVVGVAGGVAGWFSSTSEFPATAFIRVRRHDLAILRPLSAPAHDSYYLQLLTLPHVLRRALDSPDVKDLPDVRKASDPEQWLKGRLRGRLSSRSEVMQVTVEHSLPRTAQALANAAANAFLVEVRGGEDYDIRHRKAELDRNIAQSEQELQRLWETLQRLANRLGSGDAESLQIREQMMAEEYRERTRQLRKTQLERRDLQRALIRARNRLASDTIDIPEHLLQDLIRNDPAIVNKREELARTMMELQAYLAYDPVDTDKHLLSLRDRQQRLATNLQQLQEKVVPQIKESAQFIVRDNLRTAVASTEAALQDLDVEEETFQEMLSELESELQAVGAVDVVQLERIRRDIHRKEAFTNVLWKTRESMRIEEGAEERFDMLADAPLPRRRSYSKQTKLALMGAAGGFGLIAMIVALLEHLAQRVTGPQNLSQQTGMELLGTLPLLRDVGDRIVASEIAYEGPDHGRRVAYRESLDTIAATIVYGANGTSPPVRSLMITSASSGEGKSTLALNLAARIARSDQNTLLVDLDIRRPTLHRLLETHMAPGVTDVVAPDADLAGAVRATDQTKLHVLPCGRPEAEPYEFLMSERFRCFVGRLREAYEFLVFDVPPVLPVPDALLVGQYVDAAVFAVHGDVSRTPHIRAATRRLQAVGVPILGAVMNARQVRVDRYYAYQAYAAEEESREEGIAVQS